MALKVLREILEKNNDHELETVDVLAQPKRAFRAGIKMIPTIEAGGKKISGIILKKDQIEHFLVDAANTK